MRFATGALCAAVMLGVSATAYGQLAPEERSQFDKRWNVEAQQPVPAKPVRRLSPAEIEQLTKPFPDFNKFLADKQAADEAARAAAELKKSRELPPPSAEELAAPLSAEATAAYLSGQSSSSLGLYSDALRHFDRAIAAAPQYFLARLARGQARYHTRNDIGAIQDLDRAIVIGALDAKTAKDALAKAYMYRGGSHSRLNLFPNAVSDFDKALALDASLDQVHRQRAFAHLKMKNWDATIVDLNHIIAKNPKDELAISLRGNAKLEKKAYAAAAEDFREALALKPDERSSIMGLRLAYAQGSDKGEPFSARLVRQSDVACEPACPEWISLQGKIEPGSTAKVQKLLKSLGKSKPPVFVDSSGGSVDDGIAIARAIRTAGLDVFVTRTEYIECGKGDAACRKRTPGDRVLGIARAPGAVCASSCAFILAGGAERRVGASTLVGVHQITSFQTTQEVWRQWRVRQEFKDGKIVEVKEIVSEKRGEKTTVQTATKDATYIKIRKFWAEMGIEDVAIMTLLIGAPPKGMHWLTGSELAQTRIRTQAEHGEQALARQGVPRVGPAGAESPAAQVAAPVVAAAAAAAAVAAPPKQEEDPAAVLTKSIKAELKRIGCTPGSEDGAWNAGLKKALERYNALTGKPLDIKAASQATLDALTARKGTVCPPACPPGMSETSDGRCVVGGAETAAPAKPAPAVAPAPVAKAAPANVVPQATKTSAPAAKSAQANARCIGNRVNYADFNDCVAKQQPAGYCSRICQ